MINKTITCIIVSVLFLTMPVFAEDGETKGDSIGEWKASQAVDEFGDRQCQVTYENPEQKNKAQMNLEKQ